MAILKETIDEFLRDECARMAAALSYYTIFSLPALLLLVMLVARPFVGEVAVRDRIEGQVALVVGPRAAEQVGEILTNVGAPGQGNPLLVVLSGLALMFAATGAFAQLQIALNRTWEVEPDPDRGGVRNFLVKRAFSFLLILGVAVLLLASMITNTILTGFGAFVGDLLPAGWSTTAFIIINFTLSFAVAVVVFAVLFMVIPDARLHWRDVWIGALATATLFLLGNFGLGLYLSRADPASSYGAAGSLAVMLVWVYYSAMIVLLGAELTQVITRRRGTKIRPSRGAVRVVIERRVVREGGERGRRLP